MIEHINVYKEGEPMEAWTTEKVWEKRSHRGREDMTSAKQCQGV